MLSLNQLGYTITRNIINNIKLKDLTNILESYKSQDWFNYIFINDFTYYKYVVFSNKYIEIAIITWSPLQESNIQEYPENGCLMKILCGSLTDITYNNKEKQNEKIINTNEIIYYENNKILHKFKNNYDISSTLHIYALPNHKIII